MSTWTEKSQAIPVIQAGVSDRKIKRFIPKTGIELFRCIAELEFLLCLIRKTATLGFLVLL